MRRRGLGFSNVIQGQYATDSQMDAYGKYLSELHQRMSQAPEGTIYQVPEIDLSQVFGTGSQSFFQKYGVVLVAAAATLLLLALVKGRN